MNLDTLNYLVTQAPEQIILEAQGNLVCPDIALKIAGQLIRNTGNLESLNAQQKEVYEKGVRPLIETVCCDGLYGDGSCVNDGLVDDSSLKTCYIEDQFLCTHCRTAQKKMKKELETQALRARRTW